MAEGRSQEIRYRFVVVGHHPPRLKGNQPHVTVKVLAGPGENLVYCGILTMAEPEWETLRDSLRASLGERAEIEDPASTYA